MEDVAIWSRLWVGIGFAADIPGPGDVLPFTAGHQGIHVERMADGSLVGRFNKAQHGGCRVVPLQCRTGTKTRCSFTACGYSRDRRAIRAGDRDGAAHLDQYLGLRPERLLPVAVEAWGPLVLAKLDPAGAKAGCDWPAPTMFDDRASMCAGETPWREVPGNWKRVAMRLADTGMSGHGAAMALFPNVVVREGGGSTIVAILQPVALDRTLCRVRVFGRTAATVDRTGAEPLVDALFQDAGLAETSDILAPVRNDAFERRVAEALDALALETPDGPLFRTDENGDW